MGVDHAGRPGGDRPLDCEFLGFKFYIRTVADYTATYGAIGGAIVTMLWFYLSGLAILIGAELNAVIEAAWQSSRPNPTP